MKYAYGRISTNDGRQNTEKWTRGFLAEGVLPENIYYEEVSGAKSWRTRKIADLVELMGGGDILIVPELSRLGRSTKDVLGLIDVFKEKGVTIKSQKEGYRLGADMTPTDQMLLTMLAMVAQFEREMLAMRVSEGIAHWKELNPGKPWGRPKGKSKTGGSQDQVEKKNRMRRLLAKGNTKASVARDLGISRRTIYNWLGE